MENSDINTIDREELVGCILSKLDLYSKMYNDKEEAFKCFDKFNYYDIDSICKLMNNGDYINGYRFNDKLIDNVKEYLSSFLGLDIKSSCSFGGSYPKYSLYIHEYFSIDLHNKTINVKTKNNISFANYMIEKYKKELTSFVGVDKDMRRWLRKGSETKAVYIRNYINTVLHKSLITKYHQILVDNSEKKKRFFMDELEKYKNSIIEIEKIHDEYMPKLEKLMSYGYRIDIEEDYIPDPDKITYHGKSINLEEEQ
jgi:hypothetical protein